MQCVLQCAAVCCSCRVLQWYAGYIPSMPLSLMGFWLNTLQHTWSFCNTLQHTATHCNTLQHTATHYNSLQHTVTLCNYRNGTWSRGSRGVEVFANLQLRNYGCRRCCDWSCARLFALFEKIRGLLQHTATHCNTLQHTATHCNTLQHTAIHCNTL